MLWRQDGRQRSLTFENLPAAERFKTLPEDHGPDEALRIIELDEISRHVPTVTEWLTTHIDNLTAFSRPPSRATAPTSPAIPPSFRIDASLGGDRIDHREVGEAYTAFEETVFLYARRSIVPSRVDDCHTPCRVPARSHRA